MARTLSRIAGTALLVALLLGAIAVGLPPILDLRPQCEQLLSASICKPSVRGFAALYLFFIAYGAMHGANKIWGRQLFKRKNET